jgi:hypothetical protein
MREDGRVVDVQAAEVTSNWIISTPSPTNMVLMMEKGLSW